MASLTHAIRSFQSGDLTHSEFFEQVDRVLATNQSNSEHLLQILDDERTRVQLPPDVYAELQRRVEHVTGSRHGMPAGDMSMQTMPSQRRFTGPTGSTSGAGSSATIFSGPSEEPYRMKGVGDTLNGRFVLEECVGFGGMGTVYKALDLRKLEASDRNPYVAIKVLNVQFRGHPKSLIALQREAKKAQTLAHPNIVAVYDFDRDGSTVYLTMEYLSGKPLSRTLRTPGFTGMSLAETMRIVNGMGKALAYAHERGFVHCDFKPANVILTDSGQVKVIDFGIARVFQKPEDDGNVEATVFDPGSLGALTPAYASPEMLEHLVPDPRDDIYALACITYELLTGRHPFDRVSATQARHAGMKPPRPKNLGHRQWRALRTALCFDRQGRTPTVARFLKEMSGERTPMEYAAWGGAGLAAVVVIALGVTFLRGRPSPPPESAVTEQPAPPVAVAPRTEPPAREEQRPAPPPPPPPPQKLTIDAVAPVLAAVPCSALLPAVRGDALDVQGYIPKSYGIGRLKETLNAVPGLKTLNVANVQQVSEEKCDAIKTFAPYWTKNRQSGGAASIRTKKPGAELVEGDYLVLDLTTPAYDSFVNVDYFAFDGSVVHLVPSPRVKDNQAPPNYSATIGSLGNWVVSKPFGTDFIVLLITPAPLFNGMRPESESAADYLRAVEKQLKQQSAKFGNDKIAVDFVQITTRARKS